MRENSKLKILIIGGASALTVAIHYGWVLQPLFGQVHWAHAIHGRFCYIPIVIAASWFGLRGGLATATLISILIAPFIISSDLSSHNLAGEIVEIIFYYAIAILSGGLVDREFKTRRQKEEMRRQLERSHQLSLVGQIAAGVAHEVKNPLASIKGAIEILSDTDTSPSEKEEFKNILQSEVKRIDNTITEFLNFARPREIRLTRMDLAETLRGSIRQIEAQAAQQNISVSSQIDDNLIIKGDSEKLHEMILNLLLNAIQVLKDNGSIVVLLRKEADALLRISDSGPGIEPGNIDKIFEPFFTTRPSGTGLGLAIVKAIVENHDGRIEISSQLNHGTEVTIRLPRFME